ITGANMAGKSTYLRTVGINYLLACTGASVCAVQMITYPAKLITGLHTSDSLNNNESYFFAELKRLKFIIDELKAGEKLFIILDEILKGTNSTDKQKGSFALMKQLIALQANGIVATHDLALGTLADDFPNEIRNYRFEAEISNDELTFSYQLKEGIAQNMNACFLMEKMGIGHPY
ncbi:DNA mismatch repair protein MutS, partial [termite gut metagenome]